MDEPTAWKDRAAAALRSLEEIIRPLAADLPYSAEPATTFRPDPETRE